MYGKPLMYVVKVGEVLPIEGADKIEQVKVMDYTVVAKKNQFKTGDLAFYIEVDSLVPDGLDGADSVRMTELNHNLKTFEKDSEDYKSAVAEIDELTKKSKYPWFEFLRARKFKIKAIKLRGVISQGILFKPEELGVTDYKLGQDFSQRFNITEIVLDEEEAGLLEAGVNTSKDGWLTKKLMRFGWFRDWRKKKKLHGNWLPSWPSKSDEENVQKVFSKMKAKYGDKEWVATEKLEGQNITIYSRETRGLFGKKKTIGVCSRTRDLSALDNNGKVFWSTVKRENLDKKIADIPGEWFCRGEHLGPGIQKNIYNLPRTTVRFFDFYKKVDGKWCKLNYEESIAFAKKYDLPFVPVLDEHYILPEDVQEMLKQSDKNTVFGNNLKHKREGFVLRLKDDYTVSFKVKNPFYEI